MESATRSINPADIVFPSQEAAPTPQPPIVTAALDMDAIEHSIWQLLGACGEANKNDRLVVVIEALIEAGVNTRPRIIGAAKGFGFDRGHVGAVLEKSEGPDPRRHRWQRDANGVYRTHAAVPA